MKFDCKIVVTLDIKGIERFLNTYIIYISRKRERLVALGFVGSIKKYFYSEKTRESLVALRSEGFFY